MKHYISLIAAALVILTSSMANTQPLSEDQVYYEYRYAAEGILDSERDCQHTTGECYGVSLDYPYMYLDVFDPFMRHMAEATYNMYWDDMQRRHMISTILAIGFAESTWGRLTAPGAIAECGDLQILSCDEGPWAGRVSCVDGPYVNANTRPTCDWLQDPTNTLVWFSTYWESYPYAWRYNGCRSSDCTYQQRFDRRYNAAYDSLSQYQDTNYGCYDPS